jgi:hypothetical protein
MFKLSELKFMSRKQMARVELRGVNQKDEFMRKVKEAARSTFPILFLVLNF